MKKGFEMVFATFLFAACAAFAGCRTTPADGCVDVTTLGVRNDGSADVSDIVNEATKTRALYFPPGRYLVEKPIVLRHSIYGRGFSRCPDKSGGDREPDDTRTWFISRLDCDDGSQAIVSFGEKRNINVEEVNFMCASAETAIRVLPGKPGNSVFLSGIGIYQLGGTGISIECKGSRPVFVQDVSIWGSTRRYYEGSRGIFVSAWDCRLSNVEVMAAQIALEVHAGYTYGENMHLWTGCMAKEGDKASWWKGTRAVKCGGGAHLVGSNIYPDTSYYPFEFVGRRSIVDLRGIMYWDDRSERGCEDRNGALLKCDEGVDPCLKIDGGFWGVAGSDKDPFWMKYLYQPKAEIRNVTVRSNMDVKGANLDTLCMNTDLPEYRVDYATNGWCKVAEVFVTEKSGSCEGTFTLDDGAAWALSFLKAGGKAATLEARPLNALCAGREIKAVPGDGTLKAFLRSDAPFSGRFVTTRMTPRFRPVDYGHLRTHDGAVRYRERLDESLSSSLALRDSVRLRSAVHVPAAAKDRKVGTSLVFSPYKTAAKIDSWAKERSDKGGYARVQVDCRGTGGSEGRFVAYRPDTVDDAKDVLDAIAAQPWSDGRVVMSGGSFPGWTQFCAMRSGHPALVACSPSVMILDPYHLYFSNGCRVDKFQPGWHRKLAGTNDYDEVVSHTKRSDPFWERLADVRRLDESRADVFYQGGWFDMIGLKTMETYNRLRKNGRRVFLRMGPWAHGVNTYADGGIDFSKLGGSVTEDLELDFLEKALRGEKPQTDDLPGQILLYVMGRNEWRYETEWPLKGTKFVPWPFGKGKATFRHDPANPVPTCGGRLTPGGGIREQSAVEARADVLKFTGEELKEDLEVTGDVKAHIVFSSTSVTNDIAVRLVDVHPDGKAYGVVDSICRADDCVPGKAKTIDFPVDSTAYVFLKGHRIRVDVAGSSKPHYEVNPTPAEVTVDAAASRLILPVIPAKR